jgi:BMFP domain-containing protein YqiC
MRPEFKEDCKYAKEIREDVEKVFNKWLKRYGLDVPEMDESLAAKLILAEMRGELESLEEKYCGNDCDIKPPSCEN